MSSTSAGEPKAKRSWAQRLVLGTNMVAILTALSLAVGINAAYSRAGEIERVQLEGVLTVNEANESGDRVLNVLLVGYDSSAGLDEDDPIQIGREENSLGDVIIIAHIDEREQTAALLSLPRDLWVPIAGLGRSERINAAYAIGGPETLIETIEEEFEIPIHHYASVDFAGFEGIIEALGSVEIYFDAPARDWNANPSSGAPRSQTGFEMLATGCQVLDPSTALAYVRSRYYQKQDEDGDWYTTQPWSDIGRMERQQDFLQATLSEAISQGARNPFVLSELIDRTLESVIIDQELTPQLIVDLGNTFRQFEPGELDTYSMPVVDGTVGIAQVLFEVEESAEPVLEIFRGLQRSDPGTVNLRVVRSGDAHDEAEDAVASLESFGFEVGGPSTASADPGILIRHGADGLQAAQLAWFALDGNATLQQVDGLEARDVIVLVGGEGEEVDVEFDPDTEVASGDDSGEVAAGSDDIDLTAAPETDTSQDPFASLSSVEACG